MAVVVVDVLGLSFLSHEGSLRDAPLQFWVVATRPSRSRMTRVILTAIVAVEIVNAALGTSRRGHHGEND